MKIERLRLSVDLEKYPDVKDMLNAAIEATGYNKTEITVQALRRQLPQVVSEVHDKSGRFVKLYPPQISSGEDSRTFVEGEARAYGVATDLKQAHAASSSGLKTPKTHGRTSLKKT